MTRILVNSANIESRILADTRLEAQRCLEKLPKGGTAYTRDGFLVRVFPCVSLSFSFYLFFFLMRMMLWWIEMVFLRRRLISRRVMIRRVLCLRGVIPLEKYSRCLFFFSFSLRYNYIFGQSCSPRNRIMSGPHLRPEIGLDSIEKRVSGLCSANCHVSGESSLEFFFFFASIQSLI